jgi:hypothetical protein
MDGWDLEADPPTIVSPINVWDSVPRQKVVCELDHGDPVELVESKWVESEERYYVLVNTSGCRGWVSDPFISMGEVGSSQKQAQPITAPQADNPAPASQNVGNQTETYFTTGSARARECARTDCTVITTFVAGTLLTVTDWVQGDAVSGNDIWRQIDHNGQTVFVHSSLLSVTAPRPASPP